MIFVTKNSGKYYILINTQCIVAFTDFYKVSFSQISNIFVVLPSAKRKENSMSTSKTFRTKIEIILKKCSMSVDL